MLKALKVSKIVISIAVLLFFVMVVWGIYTAMDSAAGYTIAQSSASERSAASEYGSSEATSKKDSYVDTSESASPDGVSTSASGSVAGQSANNDSSTDGTATDSTVSTTGSSSSGSNPANNNTPSQPTTPARTYHPPWDEWVVEGHTEDVYIAATYGQRAIFGSVCNDCSANISGVAVAHLKETRHSGYHEGVVGYEDYEITPARTEQVWVDTSHTVHHEGYYS